MAFDFRYEVESFLLENMIAYHAQDNCILVPSHNITLSLVEVGQKVLNMTENSTVTHLSYTDTLYDADNHKFFVIYEDLWFAKGDIIRNRLLANFGLGAKIFARKCLVGKIDAERSKLFLEANHLIGDARSVFRYGLFNGKELVSVATFSASRPMERQGRVVRSFEWVRYANKTSLRVVGGMGRLLERFMEDHLPDEVMSYADKEWSTGDVYRRLGFEQIGETPPVEFFVDMETYERIPVKKLLKDRKYRNYEISLSESRHDLSNQGIISLSGKQYALLLNLGNFKFLRSCSFR